MDDATMALMQSIVTSSIYVPELKELLQESIREKYKETSIWSALTSSAHLLAGGRFPHIDRVAACSELLLLAFDIADDLQDGDNLEKPWMRVSRDTALNAFSALLVTAIGEIASLERIYLREPAVAPSDSHSSAAPIVAELSAYITQAINGQQQDIANAIDSEKDYMAMASAKSGAVMNLALMLGYGFAGAQSQNAVWNRLGTLLGLMGQLRNDMRDVLRWDKKSDLLFKRKTFPILYLLTYSEEDFPPLLEFYEGKLTKEQFADHKQECIAFIRDSGCLEYTREVLRLHLEQAELVLAELDADKAAKRAFADIAFAAFR